MTLTLSSTRYLLSAISHRSFYLKCLETGNNYMGLLSSQYKLLHLSMTKETSEAKSNSAWIESDSPIFKIWLAVANNIVPVVAVIILITCAVSSLLLAADVEVGSFEWSWMKAWILPRWCLDIEANCALLDNVDIEWSMSS